MLATKKLIMLLSATSLCLSANAFAADSDSTQSETSVKMEDVKVKKEKNDIDNEITNARMRASSGSKSKMSMSSSLGYSMGSIKKPFNELRPDIYGNPEAETRTSIDGSISGRYRFDKNNSMTLGGGVAVLTPLQGDTAGDNESQFDISNPSVGYSRVYKLGRFQNITSASYTYGTADAWKGVNLRSKVNVGQNMLTSFADNKVTVGMALSLSYYDYSDYVWRASDTRTAKSGGLDRRTAYSLGVYPYAEYAFNDTYSLRTVFGYMNFRHRRYTENKSALKMEKSPSYQSIGVGMALTRDVYIYPNIQFLPEDLEADKTNVAISTTINLF